MSNWVSAISSATPVITALASVFGVVVLVWSKVRENEAMARDMKTIQATFVIRNWLLLAVGAAGMVGMLSVAVVPLTPSSVLVCAVGAVSTAFCWAAVFALEIARISSKYFWQAHELHAKAQHDFSCRMLGVLETLKRPAPD